MSASLYTLSDPRTGEVRYVGWTVRKPSIRLSAHMSDARRGIPDYRCRWIRVLLAGGVRPTLSVLALVEEADGAMIEKRAIAAFRARAARLVNATDGGEGAWGWKPSPETLEKMSRGNRGRKPSPKAIQASLRARFGKPLSPEHRAKLSLALRGKKRGPLSPEHRAKIGAANRGNTYCLGHRHTPGAREKMRLANLGRKHSPESIKKTAMANRGKKRAPRSAEWCAKLSEHQTRKMADPIERARIAEALRGGKQSPETSRRKSFAQRARHERERSLPLLGN